MRTRVAVVGVGYLGRFHVEKYAAEPDVELVGVVDSDAERAREAAARFGCRAFSDASEIYGLVDCASVAVPTPLHRAIGTGLLEAGVDVLVEKPIAVTLEEARDLVRVAEERGRILQVGHLERFNPAIRALAELLTRPRFLECHRLAPFVERGTDVNVVLDLMIHDLDVILSMMKSPVAAIEAVGVPVITASPDIANARIRFADGAIANVTASRVSLKRERKLRIFQHDTYISLDYGEKRMRICRRGQAPPGGLAPIEVEERVVEGEDALAEEIRGFLGAVRTRQPPLVSGREGLRAVELAYQILERIEEELRRSQ
ncbi:MAG TPA: Gfo/Idh/MocA family oxidoreductase [Candidatus Binatia bacterium]|nr:Gfo/Idh/MocA family oxidoreductase [Candidatus Binatia bacterium]